MHYLLFALAFLIAGPPQPAAPDLPKVLLVGDSIRLGYTPVVTQKLQGHAIIASPKANNYDTASALKNLDGWLAEKPRLVVFNSGLHDLKYKDGKFQVPPDQYEKNLKQIVAKIRASGAKIVFATSTPINDEKHRNRKLPFERKEAYVKTYNDIAERVMKAEKVPIVDLHAVVVKAGMDKIQQKDGAHYTAEGYGLLGAAVTEIVVKELGNSGAK